LNGAVEMYRSAEELMKSPQRQDLLHLIEQEPGMTLSSLARALGWNPTPTVYHLDKLVDAKVVAIHKIGDTSHYAPKSGDRHYNSMASALQDPTRKRIVQLMCKEPVANNKTLAEGTDNTPSMITYHMQILAAAELVIVTRHGREKCHTLTPEAKDAALLYFEKHPDKKQEAHPANLWEKAKAEVPPIAASD
jgi:predicted transcriptional regulator